MGRKVTYMGSKVTYMGSKVTYMGSKGNLYGVKGNINMCLVAIATFEKTSYHFRHGTQSS